MGERLDFDVFARDNASGTFVKTGRAAAAASDDVLGLAKRLDEVGKKSATARVGLAGNDEALAQLDKLDHKLLVTGRKVTANVSVDGAERASLEITGLNAELDKLSAKSVEAEAATGGAGGAGGLSGASGLGALVGVGVVLSPIIATLATGLAGFGAAAYGAAAPIMKAAQATGGLQKNMHTLSPEQQGLAKSILGLGHQYDAFQQALQPEVLNVFGRGIKLAGDLMREVEPVAKATGTAIGGLLSQIDAEFKSGTWQQFFGFMATTAGPDMKLLGGDFVALMNVLPPLLEALQPVATQLLQMVGTVATVAAKVGDLSRASSTYTKVGNTSLHTTGNLASAMHGLYLISGAWIAQGAWKGFSKLAGFSGDAAKGVSGAGTAAAATAAKTKLLAAQVTALTTAMQANIGETLTLQGDTIGLQQAQQAALTQIRSNTAGLAGNSKNALANKAAVLAASQAAQTLANEQLTKLHPNLQLASRDLQDQISWLQKHGDKSAFATREIKAFTAEEAKIKAQINSNISVLGTGHWNVLPGGTPQPGTHPHAARGMLITGGRAGVDDQLILAQRGETVVPARLTPTIAPLMKAHGVPGFASGGVVGSYHGAVAGLTPWLSKESAATLTAIEAAVASAVKTGIASAGSGGGRFGHSGPGGGAPAANAALARRMFPGENFSAWNYVAMRESGWNQFALNPSSGAYGIAQALPPTKYPFAGQAAGGSNPAAQISWMEGYMRSRYGGAAGAAAHEQAFNWYDRGGFLPVGASMALNKTGSPERVLSGSQERGIEARLDRVISLLERIPAATGHALADGLQGTARRAGARGMYAPRGAWA